ncbi:MAG: NuoI/complex I 23 kDa subunit family protein [Bacteroidota bacterium]
MVQLIKNKWSTFKSIFTGMGVTMRHMFQPAVTIQYPEERDVLPPGVRARLIVDIDDCIACGLCERACPVDCITIEKVKATDDVDLGKTSTGNPKKFWLAQFDIDMSRCMYCDLCVHPCPTECITMEPEYEYSEYDRTNLVYHFSNLSPAKVAEVKEAAEIEAEEKKRKRAESKRKKAAAKKKKAMEAKKQAASNGETPKKKSADSENKTEEN